MKNRRQAFTLVELLVVIAIIGILVSLLLPAVQAAREAARRMQCVNHLKQMGVAWHNFENTHKFFPGGGWGATWVGDPDEGVGKAQPGGWTYQMLPFMEAQSLHDIGLGATGTAERDANAALIATPVPFMNCPTRRAAIAYPMFLTHKNSAFSDVAARGDYAACAGDADWSEPYTNEPDTLEEGRTFVFPANPQYTGVCYEASETSVADVVDGLSNTYFVGEKYLIPDHYLTGRSPADDWSMYSGHQDDNHRVTWNGTNPQAAPGDASRAFTPLQDTPGLENRTRFGSAHTSTWNVLMGDSSVQSLSYSIDFEVHRRLGHMFDELPVELP